MSDDDFSTVSRPSSALRTTPRDGKHRGPRFSWTAEYEETFFRALCECVQLGLREGSTFRAEAWDRAAQALADRHSAYPAKNHLINKSDNARKKFRLWRSLREDPEFSYDPSTRTVSGTEEAWRAHIEKEPLSRSLKAKPFDYEHYYEILFPDVIGSGGAPKRITRPRRKDGPTSAAGEQGSASPAILEILSDSTTYSQPQQQPQQQPTHQQLLPHQHQQQQQQQQQPPPPPPTNVTSSPSAAGGPRPSSTTIPPRTSITSTSALTPPEESAPHSRKRLLPTDPNAAAGFEKRRRTDPVQVVRPASWTGAPQGVVSGGPVHDGIVALGEALRSARARSGWSEQALDIFFRDFGDEDMDLQLKIAEKALTDDNKAMVFCKMPVALRKHWVKRLREVHNRIA